MEKTELSKEDILRAQFADWLKQPITVELLKRLEKLRQEFIDYGVSKCTDFETNSEMFRLYSHGYKTVNRILNEVKNVEAFLKENNK
jgi:hypothetical protein